MTSRPTPEEIATEEEEWMRTGRIRCHDCGTRVTTRTLETLPDHHCTQRQRARREQEKQK